jgi:hypothetical protein
MFCAHRLIFGCTEGDGSRFHVWRAQTHFWRYRGRQVPFSCFALPNSFSAVPRASSHVFMFCVPGLVFGGNEGVGTRFDVLRARTHFRRYFGRQVPFSCFALTNWFFDGDECVGSRFHVFRAQTHFRRFGVRQILFSCFSLPDVFLAVQRASGPIFMFCAPGHVFSRTEGVGSRFHVLRARTRFRRF